MITPFFIFLLFFSLPFANAQQFEFDFHDGQQGWDGNFADYPVGYEALYELEFDYLPLPKNIDPAQKSLMISGKNHSDDLFMYIYKKVAGLIPNHNYQIIFDIEFASKARTNGMGVGGAPGESVHMKAGAILHKPDRVISDDQGHQNGFYLINLDKGNQGIEGPDMKIIGHVGVMDTTTVFALKTNQNKETPFPIQTDSSGTVWLVIGTDSGFESTTMLYYNKIKIDFESASSIELPPAKQIIKTLKLHQNFPNPFNPQTTIAYEVKKTGNIELAIYNTAGQRIKWLVKRQQSAGKYAIKLNGKGLASGVYFYRLSLDNESIVKKMVLIE
jgi:hypothetical protein